MVSQASGSIAGITFSRNKGGAYMRSRVRGTNPNSVDQTRARSVFSSYASLWASLTLVQQQTWVDYAESAPFFNALGDPITPSGISLYIASNTLLTLAQLSPVSVAPLGLTRPSLEVSGSASVSYDVSTPAFTVTGVTPTNFASTGGIVLFTSPVRTGGQKSFKTRYRYAEAYDETFASADLSANRYLYGVGDAYRARLRAVSVEGAISEPVFVEGVSVA
jgi:hypothetical protein